MFCKCNNKENEIRQLEIEIDRLEDELNLEKTWAEGEIDFWKQACYKAEEELARVRKPWWRHVIS